MVMESLSDADPDIAPIRFLPSLFRPLVEGPLRNYRIWIGLGWIDTVQAYRRTILGPFWLTLNLVIFTTAVTLVYGALFGVPTNEYASYVVCGMMVWLWISALLSDLGNTFIHNAAYLRGLKMDKAILIWASVLKQLIALGHQFIVFVPLVVLGMVNLTPYTLLAIPAVAVLFLFSIPFTAVTSIIFARFRDVPRLIGGSMIVLMMLTPIFWQPPMISGWRSAFVYLNPVYYLIQFVRLPLLGQPIDLLTMGVVLGMTALVWIVGALFYRRYEPYVVFWV